MESLRARVAVSEMAYMVHIPHVSDGGRLMKITYNRACSRASWCHLCDGSPSTIRRNVMYVKWFYRFAASSLRSWPNIAPFSIKTTELLRAISLLYGVHYWNASRRYCSLISVLSWLASIRRTFRQTIISSRRIHTRKPSWCVLIKNSVGLYNADSLWQIFFTISYTTCQK